MIKPKLKKVRIDLITNNGVDMFYVGHQRRFDAIVRSVLRELKEEYSQTHYAISWRNNRMLRQSDYIVTYITHSWEGVAQYAKRQRKKIISIL